MADLQTEKDIETIIPENVLSSKRYIGFRRKNIIEACIFTLLVIAIILTIPFVRRIKIIFCIVVGASIFILNCVGLHGQSFTELMTNLFYSLRLPKVWHMRSINNEPNKRKANSKVTENNVYTNQSIAEKGIALAKQKYKEFRESKI